MLLPIAENDLRLRAFAYLPIKNGRTAAFYLVLKSAVRKCADRRLRIASLPGKIYLERGTEFFCRDQLGEQDARRIRQRPLCSCGEMVFQIRNASSSLFARVSSVISAARIPARRR